MKRIKLIKYMYVLKLGTMIIPKILHPYYSIKNMKALALSTCQVHLVETADDCSLSDDEESDEEDEELLEEEDSEEEDDSLDELPESVLFK